MAFCGPNQTYLNTINDQFHPCLPHFFNFKFNSNHATENLQREREKLITGLNVVKKLQQWSEFKGNTPMTKLPSRITPTKAKMVEDPSATPSPCSSSSSSSSTSLSGDGTPTLGTRVRRRIFSATPKRKSEPVIAANKKVKRDPEQAEPTPPPIQESGGCGFFEWCENTSTTTPASKAQYCVSNAAQSSTPSSCFPDVPCPCGAGMCLILTAKTGKNMGQQFYRCPATSQENGGCGFFEWCDNTPTTTPASKAQYSVSNAAQSPTPSSIFPDVPCPCGAGICLILTAKTEKNMGQQFYRCPSSQESKCDFFMWCIERNSTVGQQSSTNLNTSNNTSSSFNKSSSYGEANIVNVCSKCGQNGHWAKDCKEPSSVSPGFDVSGNKSGVSGTCYKCGVPGHWAKDCVMKASSGGGSSWCSGGV